MSKLVDVIPVLKNDSSSYQSVAPPLSVSYTKPETDTLSDLIAPTLKKWCQEFSINIDSADASIVPNCVSSGHKPLLARHWKIIVAKVTKAKPSEPSPMEDTDGTLNVDKLLLISYKRTLAAPDTASMPQIWLAPISPEATKFAIAMKERYDAITSKAKQELEKEKEQISAPPSPSGSSPPEKSDAGKQSRPGLLSVAALINAESTKKETNSNNNNNNNKSISITPETATKLPNVALQQQQQQKSSVSSTLPKMGIISQHSLDRERLPESVAKINKYFDQVYTDFVEKKIWLFRYDGNNNNNNNNVADDSKDIHDEKCYVHWSDILKSDNKNPVFREGKSLRNFQGDKSSLSDALGVAWEAAAEAEEHALANWNALQSEKKKNLENQIAADEEEIKDAEKRQQDMKSKSESMMIKKAEIQVKEDRLKILQEDIAAMELRLEAAKQVKAEIEEEKRREAEKQSEIRETLMRMEHEQQQESQRISSSSARSVNKFSNNKIFSSSPYSPIYSSTSTTSLQSAMSVLNPATAAQVQRALVQCDEQQLHVSESAKRNRLVVNKNNNNHNDNNNNSSATMFAGSNNATPYRNNGNMNSTADFSRPNSHYGTGTSSFGEINNESDHSKYLVNQTATSASILSNTKHTDIRAAMAKIHNQYGYESVYTAAASNDNNGNNNNNFNDSLSKTPPPQNPLAALNIPLHQQHHSNHNNNNNIGNNNFPSELKNWQQPGSLSSAIVMQKSNTNRSYHNNNNNNSNYGQNIDHGEIDHRVDADDHNNNDMRVPLRLLASDLDAFLTRSEKNSEQVLPTFRSRQQEHNHHQGNENSNHNSNNNRAQFDKDHFLTSSSSTHQNHRKIQSQMMVDHHRQQQGQNKNNYNDNYAYEDYDTSNGSEYGDDLETRKRIIHRIHDLKNVLNDPNYRPSGRR